MPERRSLQHSYIRPTSLTGGAAFPEGFTRSEQATSGDKTPRLLAACDPQLFEKLLKEIIANNGVHQWQLMTIPIADQYLYLGLAGFDRVMKQGEPSESSASQARYFARHSIGETTFLIQAMNQDSTTSCHFHPDGEEVYHCLHGEAHLLVASLDGCDRQLITLQSGHSYTVGKDMIHTVRTTRQGSVMLLEMIGAHGHHYVDQMVDGKRQKMEEAIAALGEGLIVFDTQFDRGSITV